jgi:hypothetical protein
MAFSSDTVRKAIAAEKRDLIAGVFQKGLERRLASLTTLLEWCNEEEQGIFENGGVVARMRWEVSLRPRRETLAALAVCAAADAALQPAYEREVERRLALAIW